MCLLNAPETDERRKWKTPTLSTQTAALPFPTNTKNEDETKQINKRVEEEKAQKKRSKMENNEFKFCKLWPPSIVVDVVVFAVVYFIIILAI